MLFPSDNRTELVLLAMSRVNPSGQLIPMQPLAYSLQQDGEGNQNGNSARTRGLG